MRISVFGLGYVGCVSAACLARDGHTVIGVDVDPHKVAATNAGCAPVLEPGLEKLIGEVVNDGRLQATVDARAAVQQTEISLICVGTPSNANGSLNLRYLDRVCIQIGAALAGKNDYHVVIVRSTVLPGTVQGRLSLLLEQHSDLRAGEDFGVCMNPEFLREGSAIEDYDHPSVVVIGELDAKSGDAAQRLYEPVNASIVRTSIPAAEMLKYVNNAFHAVKVAFANEIGNLCTAHGIDGREVMEHFCLDRRLNISPAYLMPGFAFGGSCLPKDLRALVYRAKEQDVDCPLLSAVLPSNQKQIHQAIEMVERTRRRKIGILGLSFKAGTDDIRESPVVHLVEALVGKGYQVGIFDEKLDLAKLTGANKSFLEQELPHIATLLCSSLGEVVAQSEAIVIGNNDKGFRNLPGLLREDQLLIYLVGITRDTPFSRSVPNPFVQEPLFQERPLRDSISK
jgi:GDP-mannose 6-dehydrogenase